MGRWQRKYSDEQRRAVDRLVNVEGKSCPQAARILGEHGCELEDGIYVGPFEIPKDSVNDIARKMRVEQLDHAAPLDHREADRALDELSRRGLTLLEYSLQRLDAKRRGGKDIEPKLLAETFRACDSWRRGRVP